MHNQMDKSNILDVAVIGAGPSGLIMAKQLADTGLNFRIFERNEDVGGIWDINAPNSPMYESAHFISSKTLSGFPGFPMPEHYPDYPNHKQLLAYIRSYADRYQLREYISFNTGITSASRNEVGNWVLHLTSGDVVECHYLVAANGVTWQPKEVLFAGEFNGEIRHAVTYRSSEEFKGKRVLIVGAGNSGVDIACDASFAADQAFLSVRRGYHFVPKHVLGKPADVFNKEAPKLPFVVSQKIFGWLLHLINGDLRRYGLPKPDHKVFQTHPIMNTQILHYLGHGDCIAKPDIKALCGDEVEFTDDSREQIDLIICATGYKHTVPFLSDEDQSLRRGRPELYLNMFSRKHDNLAILGFIEFASSAYDNFASMAELIVTDIVSKSKTLAALKKSHYPDLRGGVKYLDIERNSSYVHLDTYLKVLGDVKQQVDSHQTPKPNRT